MTGNESQKREAATRERHDAELNKPDSGLNGFRVRV